MRCFKIVFTVCIMMLHVMYLNAKIEVDGICYNINNSTLTASVTYRGTNYISDLAQNFYVGDIKVPSSFTYNKKSYSVTKIDEYAFYGCSKITSLSMPNSIVEIGKRAFVACKGLIRIEFPNSIVEIPSGAFIDCSNLESISFGSSLKVIKDNAFLRCYSLKTLYIPPTVTSIAADAFRDCRELVSVIIDSPKIGIQNSSFIGCDKISSLSFNCEQIGSWFKGISSIKRVTFNSNVKIISHDAFYGCSGIESIQFPNSISSIERAAFKNCQSLLSLDIGSSIVTIGDGAFAGCNNLTTIKVESGNQVYDSREGCNAIIESETNTLILGSSKAFIPNTVKAIGTSAFEGCTNLTTITIPESVNSIGTAAFAYANNLKEVTMSDNITEIGGEAFRGTAISSIKLPKVLEMINMRAFYGCENLTEMDIETPVWYIGTEAFLGCKNLETLHIGSSVRRIGLKAFKGCTKLKNLNIDDLETWCKIDFGQKIDDETDVLTGNPLYYTRYLYVNGEMVKHLEIPTTPSGYNFCNGIFSSVAFSQTSSATAYSLGDRTFYGASLASITLPENMGYIGSMPFWYSSIKYIASLTKAPISVSAANVIIPSENTQLIIPEQLLTAYLSDRHWDFSKYATFTTVPVGIQYSIIGRGATFAKLKVDYYPITKEYEYGNKTFGRDTVTVYGLEPNTQRSDVKYWSMKDGNHVGTNIKYTTPALEIETQPAVLISNSKARICATTNGEDDSLRFGFEWRRYDAPDIVPSNTEPCPVYNGEIAGTLNNLSPGVYYKYRPFYKSDSGKLFYGEWMTFITADAYVYFEPLVHTLAVQNIAQNSAILNGVAVSGSDNVLEQGFEYWVSTSGNAASFSRAPANVQRIVATGQRMSVTITGLASSTGYYYRAYVKTAKGMAYGEQQTFTTGDGSSTIVKGIEESKTSEHYIIGYYDLQGRKLDKPSEGLIVIRYSDGTSRKTVVNRN
ncbi:MAG: leucine-rich repeat protein [Prevotella sp.]|nr:leucine-rich repeat protein [Prevotella sp.]